MAPKQEKWSWLKQIKDQGNIPKEKKKTHWYLLLSSSPPLLCDSSLHFLLSCSLRPPTSSQHVFPAISLMKFNSAHSPFCICLIVFPSFFPFFHESVQFHVPYFIPTVSSNTVSYKNKRLNAFLKTNSIKKKKKERKKSRPYVVFLP